MSLDIWHLDIPEFLEMQTENGDQRRKAYDVFPQVVVTDEFMRRVESSQQWTLVDPYEVKQKLGFELAELWGDKFDAAYRQIEESLDKEITLYKHVNARHLFKEIMKSQIETGMPYVAFKDTINRANPNQHEGYIPGVNLCVSPETKILTSAGNIEIQFLKDKPVYIWNGEEWSPTVVVQTGENQELMEVEVEISYLDGSGSFIRTLECTLYHKWFIQFDGEVKKIEAKDLATGDKTIAYSYDDDPHMVVATITRLTRTGRIADTYCVHEEKRNMAVFNEILTSQCVESFSIVTPRKYAHSCLVAGSKVLTNEGYKPIEECDGVKVRVPFSSDITFHQNFSHQTATLLDQGMKPTFLVTLANGLQFEATGDHRVISRTGTQCHKRIWAEVKDLGVGDQVEIYVPVKPIPSHVSTQHSKQDLFIGWLIGDGWILDKGVGLSFAPEKEYAMEEIFPFFQELHRSLPTIQGGQSRPELAKQVDKRTGVVCCTSGKAATREWLEDKYGLVVAKGGDKKLGDVIKGLSTQEIAGILSGLFSSDGCIQCPQHERNKPTVSLSSASLDMLNDVRECLALFGIHSTIGYHYLSDRGRSQGNLTISGEGMARFASLIGFALHPKKQAKLESIVASSDFSKTNYRRTTKITAIEPTGVKQVYDLALPTGHNYVAEGVIHHNCNLDSINLANVAEEEIPDVCEIAVRLLDNTIDITTAPFEEAKAHNNRYRTIGVGAMGLADWLAKRKLSYRDTDRIATLFEDIGYYCTRASADLAKERGAYAAFAGSEWSKGHLIGAKPIEWYRENASQVERWEELSADVKKYGIRNSHITAIAPNTSSSLVQGCTASILPTYSKFFYDKWAKGTVPIAPPFIADAFWFYQENKSMDQKVVVKAVAEMQKWIDTGISMELIFNLNQGVYFADEPERSLTAKDIFETLLLSWKEGCKAIYYIRTVQKDNFKEGGEACASCAN